jgi:hypothetical protein
MVLRFSCQGQQPKGSKHSDDAHSGRSCYGFFLGGGQNKIVFYKGSESVEVSLAATGAYHAKQALFEPLKHQRFGNGLTFVGLGQQELKQPMPKIEVSYIESILLSFFASSPFRCLSGCEARGWVPDCSRFQGYRRNLEHN